MKESSLYKRHFISKHSTGHCGVGKMMKRWGFRTDDSCPRCKSSNESAPHVILCPHPSATKLWLEQVESLKTWMRAQKTKGDIITAIIRNLKKLRKIGGIYGHYYKDNTLRIAPKAQDQIGWDHFMLGRINKQWSILQEQNYRDIKSRRTGERWASNPLKEICNIHWTMWNHRYEAVHATGNYPVLGSRRFDKEIFRELKKGWRRWKLWKIGSTWHPFHFDNLWRSPIPRGQIDSFVPEYKRLLHEFSSSPLIIHIIQLIRWILFNANY